MVNHCALLASLAMMPLTMQVAALKAKGLAACFLGSASDHDMRQVCHADAAAVKLKPSILES
jgi:hypothetical protein